MREELNDVVDRWRLTILFHVADTGLARIWKVRTGDGSLAALKLYARADRGNEAPGSRLLAAWRDRGAVPIIAETSNAVLMQWLEGASLGDMARRGRQDAALTMLAETARRLHRVPQVEVKGLQPLEQVFAPLLGCARGAGCPTSLWRDLARATALAERLLDSQDIRVPLHGDLHPDNVILTKSGPRVIDAKGYWGDPGFELANALRHPKGMPELVRQPAQIDRSVALYSGAMGVSPRRLSEWAAAKCALSIVWRSDGTVTEDAEADLLSLLVEKAGQ